MGKQISSLRLAYSLARIPRLFASLFLMPLLLSIVLLYGQMLITGIWLGTNRSDPGEVAGALDRLKKENLGRRLLYGDGKELPEIKICRWTATLQDGEEGEVAPEDCSADLLDVAIHTQTPQTFDATAYRKIFNGNVEHLHLCRRCTPHIVIDASSEAHSTTVRSVWGLMVLSLIRFNEQSNQTFVKMAEDFHEIRTALGPVELLAHGFVAPINFRNMTPALAITLNVAGLFLLTMWLALRAHRKVLDYFSRSGALLPMVAATGQGTFYGALWLLTFARVVAFLLASVPLLISGFCELFPARSIGEIFDLAYVGIALWATTLAISLSLATLISSIAELKQRHHVLSFFYRYVPLILSGSGLLIWSISFLFDSTFAGALRNLISALPILGIGPVLLAAIFKPYTACLLIHLVSSILLGALILRHNARWFAAHLEEL